MCCFFWGGDTLFYPGQEPDPTSGRRECQAELHCPGWWEALCGDRIRCAAAVWIPKPHRTAQGDGKWCLKVSFSSLGELWGHKNAKELAKVSQESASSFALCTAYKYQSLLWIISPSILEKWLGNLYRQSRIFCNQHFRQVFFSSFFVQPVRIPDAHVSSYM